MKLEDLTPTQLRRLAALTPCSEGSLRHASKGRRRLSSQMAIAVERAAKRMKLLLRREDMSTGCERCEFARACRKTV
jgi:hypothetical protein